jgi:hypothetical protein
VVAAQVLVTVVQVVVYLLKTAQVRMVVQHIPPQVQADLNLADLLQVFSDLVVAVVAQAVVVADCMVVVHLRQAAVAVVLISRMQYYLSPILKQVQTRLHHSQPILVAEQVEMEESQESHQQFQLATD